MSQACQDNAAEWYSNEAGVAFTCAIISFVVSFFAIFPLGHLVLFHLYLFKINKTTFAYVKMQQNRGESKVVVRLNKVSTSITPPLHPITF